MSDAGVMKHFTSIRGLMHLTLQGLSDEDYLFIPPGGRNNILWNLGHVLVDNADMIYRSSGLDFPFPAHYETFFAAGTAPADWNSQPPPPAEIAEQSRKFTDRVVGDYESGAFTTFDPAAVHSGWPLDNADQAMMYLALHESAHLGVIMTLRRLALASRQKA